MSWRLLRAQSKMCIIVSIAKSREIRCRAQNMRKVWSSYRISANIDYYSLTALILSRYIAVSWLVFVSRWARFGRTFAIRTPRLRRRLSRSAVYFCHLIVVHPFARCNHATLSTFLRHGDDALRNNNIITYILLLL